MLQLAAGLSDLETVTALIEAGAPVDGVCDPEVAKTHLGMLRPDLSRTPLTLAAGSGNAAVVARLISAGAKVDAQDREGDTALMAAVGHYHTECVRLLLEAGADPSKKNKSGESARTDLKYMKPEIAALLKRKDFGKGPVKAVRDELAEVDEENEDVETPGPYPWGPEPDVSSYERESVLERLRAREQVLTPEVLSELEDLAGGVAQPAPDLAGFTVHVESRRTIDVADVQRRFLDRGCFVFRGPSTSASGYPQRLVVLPTTDRYEAMAALGVNGDNYGISNLDVIRWMKGFEQEHPHTVLELGFDAVVVSLADEVGNPERLAGLVYAFCPDIVDQGDGDIADVANRIAVQRQIYFWWD